MRHYLDWILIGWALLSALATPFVGRFLATHLSDADDDLSSEPDTPPVPVMSPLPTPEP